MSDQTIVDYANIPNHLRVEIAPPELRTVKDGEVKPLKLILVSPTYGHIDPLHSKRLRIACMTASNRGHKWAGDASPSRMLIEGARSAAVVESMQSEDADGIVWVDSDIILEAGDIARLVSYDKDFVSGVYFQRHPPNYPLVGIYSPEQDMYRLVVNFPDNMLLPADGVGFGFCYTSMKMLRHMSEAYKDGMHKDHGLFSLLPSQHGVAQYSEDFSFCRRASKLGYKVWIDTGLMVGHQGEAHVVTIADFKANNPYCRGTATPVAVGVEA
jgi:hypothetical protein